MIFEIALREPARTFFRQLGEPEQAALRELFQQLRRDPYADGVQRILFYPPGSSEPRIVLEGEPFQVTYRLTPALGFAPDERLNIEILAIAHIPD